MPPRSPARDRAIIEQMARDARHPNRPPQGPPEYIITLAPGMRLRFERGSCVVMSLLIDETTARDAVMACWEAIAAWRDQLAVWQGPTSPAGRYIANLARWHGAWRQGQHGKPSAADLARGVNVEVAGALEDCVAVARHRRHPLDAPAIAAPLAGPPAQAPADPWAWGLYDAAAIFDAVGLSAADIVAYCQYAIANLAAGRPAAQRDYPVTRQHIKTCLKTYRRRHPPTP
jgi:hypothetical protein